MTLCLSCGKAVEYKPTVASLFSVCEQPQFCDECIGKFCFISQKDACRGCGRDLLRLDRRFHDGKLCRDCRRWESRLPLPLFHGNMAVLTYNEPLKTIIADLKFRGDAAIIEGFGRDWQSAYRRLRGLCPACLRYVLPPWVMKNDAWLIVPIPLSTVRLEQRRFNQADLLADMLPAEKVEALLHVSPSPDRQSMRNREQRMENMSRLFILQTGAAAKLTGRRLLIVDDIYTTGATIRAAAARLSTAGPLVIRSLTLIHG
ncbi:MAG: phosphoribosyltransferase family protein [Sporolactobacillus sp.]